MHRIVIGSLLSIALLGCEGAGFNENLHKVELETKTVELDDVKVEISLPKGIAANSEQTKKSRAWWDSPKTDGDPKAALTVRIAARGGAGLRMTTRSEALKLIKDSKGKEDGTSDSLFFLSGWTGAGKILSVRSFEAARTPLYCDASVKYNGVDPDDSMKAAHVAYADKICGSLKRK